MSCQRVLCDFSSPHTGSNIVGACSAIPRTYSERVRTGCNSCRSGTFRYERECCPKVPSATGGSYIEPLTCPVLQGALLIPFTTDPLTSTDLTRSSFDQGRMIKSPLIEGTDFAGAVYPSLPTEVTFNVIDFLALQKDPVIEFTSGSIRVKIIARQFMGQYILETSQDSPNTASELPLGTVNARIFTSAYGGCDPFTIDFDA